MTNIFQHTSTMLINRMQSSIELINKIPSFCSDKGLSEEEVLNSRLAPDMLPFKKQIQVMSDNAKGCVARLNNIENPKFEDNEQTAADLVLRLQKTIEFVKANPISRDETALEAKINFPWMPQGYLRGIDYVIEYLIPNFNFHSTIAYAILRNLGMQIGKSDYINQLSFQQA